ncbi:RHS repeat domain-containing protein [Shewanella sp. 10N.286.51.B2]|uniref:RHS repeat domain-containing protein n=1 Tax=Shewanella sp. 10N.286.51.B2 TaxID=3229707 RepID=UPI00354CD927
MTRYIDGTTSTETYQYDALNRLLSVTDNSGGLTGYSYDENGNRTSQLNSNNTSSTYSYSNLNQLVNVSHYSATGALIEVFDYSLHPTGRRIGLTQSNGSTSTYRYDNLYRLVGETIIDAALGDTNSEFVYDKVGNRLSQTINGVTTTYVYDTNDRLTQALTQSELTTYSYDDNGNTTVKKTSGPQIDYLYDLRNRMVSLDATQANNGVVAQYQYNIDGIRTSKVINGQAVNYLVDNNQAYAQVIAETNDQGSRLKTYLYGDDLISQTDAQNQTNTFHYDGLGSTRSLSDDSGEQSDQYNYLAFGELLNQTGTTDNNYLFAGEQYDAELDQYHLRARYYDQTVGRMSQMDTWQGDDDKSISLNKYLYGNSDPVAYVDPSGHTSIMSLSTGISRFGSLSAIAIPSYTNTLLAASVGVGLTFFYKEITFVMNVDAEHAGSDLDEAEKQAEYDKAKDFCDNQKPESGRNDCATLSSLIDHAEQCLDMYKAWDEKWYKGRHQEKIDGWGNRVNKLKKEHRRRCTNK